MIRTLLLVSAVSFVLAIGFFAGAFAIAGGPFAIDNGWRIHVSDASPTEAETRPAFVTAISIDPN